MTTDQAFKRGPLPVEQLTFATYNPRAIGDAEFAALKESLLRFGMVQEIVVNVRDDGELRVVGGHQRLKAAIALGWKTVPCVLVQIGDDNTEKALNIALNSRKIQGRFTDALALMLADLEVDDSLWSQLRFEELAEEAALIVNEKMLDDLAETAKAGAASDESTAPPPSPEGEVREGGIQSHVQFAIPLDERQLQLVRRAVTLCKERHNLPSNSEALTMLASRYLEQTK